MATKTNNLAMVDLFASTIDIVPVVRSCSRGLLYLSMQSLISDVEQVTGESHLVVPCGRVLENTSDLVSLLAIMICGQGLAPFETSVNVCGANS